MASCCRRYRARRLKALGDDPQLLTMRPGPPATSLYHLKPFKLSTALMAVHKDCYAPIGLIQQGGPRRPKTSYGASIHEIETRLVMDRLFRECFTSKSPRGTGRI